MKLIISLIGPLCVALLALACGGGDSGQPTTTPLSQRSIDATATLSAGATSKAAINATIDASLRITPPPTPTPLIAGPDVRACTASDLVGSTAGTNGAGGRSFLSIAIGNASSTACRLQRLPTVEFADAAGTVVAVELQQPRPCSATQTPPCLFDQPVLMLPNLGVFDRLNLKTGQAAFTLDWLPHNGAGTCDMTPLPLITSVVLVLPDAGGRVPIDVSSERGIFLCSTPIVDVREYSLDLARRKPLKRVL